MTANRELETRILNLLRSRSFWTLHKSIIRPRLLTAEGQMVFRAIEQLHGYGSDRDSTLSLPDVALVVSERYKGKEHEALGVIDTFRQYHEDHKNPEVVRGLYSEYRDMMVLREILGVASVQLETKKYNVEALGELLKTEILPEALVKIEPADFKTLIERVKADRYKRVPTGFEDVDEELQGGVGPGELMMVGGYGKSGKSAFLVSMAVQEMKSFRPVLYISLADLHVMAVELRAACQLTGQPESAVMQHPEWLATISKWQEDSGNPLITVDLCFQRVTVKDLAVIVRQTQEKYPELRLVIVDRAETMATAYGGEGHRHNIEQAFKELRGMAEERQIAVVTDSQTGVVSQWARRVTPDMAHESRVGKLAVLDIWVGIGREREDVEVRYFTLLGRRNIKHDMHRFRLKPGVLTFEAEAALETEVG